ncbi:hypothetical protein PPTG_17263 [Phytophthora nicotianae INRA-310]|uniref:Uncharacterized protein n=3 Tax=Phytophthora nicotianae TaxID=4792 RepID=W2PJY6_PHYN3|nr:hypothetical protein PPTG_17263 [Phytophthora nicotianae INRA-310]ETI33639.1 hypothetical protein F443_19705 [Phytophthora nicotianae P1569]ETM33866.1 hypothetical protein L914_18942 [Phytophthora nicotianae]ETN00936.1 hypothetical protein PPTG_17263 [Phytophthora nicotianae INRA-310]
MPNSSASKLDGPSAFSNTNQKENPSVDSRRARDHEELEHGQTGRDHDEPNMKQRDAFKSRQSTDKLSGFTVESGVNMQVGSTVGSNTGMTRLRRTRVELAERVRDGLQHGRAGSLHSRLKCELISW